MASTLAKVSGAGGQVSPECPQADITFQELVCAILKADITARELVCAILKVVLLYTNQLQQLPNFGTVWRRILECMATIMDVASSSDALLDAVPEAMQCMRTIMDVASSSDALLDAVPEAMQCMRTIMDVASSSDALLDTVPEAMQ
eukprot:gene29425-5774_t